MSTMQVFFKLSNCAILTGFSFVLLVPICVSSRKPPAENGFKFPNDDVIVFPTDEPPQGKEKRSENENFRGPEYFQHTEKFHKFHPPPFSVDGRGHRAEFHKGSHNPEFHKHQDTGKTLILEHKNQSISKKIPLDLIQEIHKFDNVPEILLKFVEGEKSTGGSFLEDRFSTGERSAATAPKPAKCKPEITTVQLASSEDASILYIPHCTKIERCGGCCDHHLYSCQPSKVESVRYSVVKTQYFGGRTLDYVAQELVEVERHLKCSCECKIKAKDCTVFQEYVEDNCTCSCKNTDEEEKCYSKYPLKIWNPERCRCECSEVRACENRYEFDPIECACTRKPTRNRYSEAQFRPRIDQP